jgi:hypothetical protein
VAIIKNCYEMDGKGVGIAVGFRRARDVSLMSALVNICKALILPIIQTLVVEGTDG